MPFISDSVLDAALADLQTNGTILRLCSSEPATFAASTTARLADMSVTIGAPAARTPNGRRVTVPAIPSSAGATASATGTATHYAIVNTGASRLLVTGSLTNSQAVTSGNPVGTSAAFDIGIPGAV